MRFTALVRCRKGRMGHMGRKGRKGRKGRHTPHRESSQALPIHDFLIIAEVFFKAHDNDQLLVLIYSKVLTQLKTLSHFVAFRDS